ncbi:MAG: RdgB/HAM1 family non-canonical purine NTP pyrophosphatase [Acidiferrobacteraceae bacterium]
MTPDAGAPVLVLASGNSGKAREIEALLSGTFSVRPQSAWGIAGPAETGLTYVENALIKVRHASAKTGLPAIGDDSGLEVDALGGAPGLYSARYAGDDATDIANLNKLLEALKATPPPARTARFRCLAVYLRHPDDPAPILCEGCWEGAILDAPRGANGFGYDPVFLVPEFGCSAAELDPAVKNRLSHRGQAFARMREALRTVATSGASSRPPGRH